MSALTKKQAKEYLKNPVQCPHCGSEDLDASPVDVDGKIGLSNVVCKDCGESWCDTYTLIAVEGFDDK